MRLAWRVGAQEDVKGIVDDAVRDAAVDAVLDISEDPFVGAELEHFGHVRDLSDCRKLYVDFGPADRPVGPRRYRFIYRLPNEAQPSTVEIVAFGPRADMTAYRRAIVRLDRPLR